MNLVILKGRMIKDVELKTTTTGKMVAKFCIAVQHSFKNEKGEYGADFINCVVWEKKAEIIGSFFKKGSNILVQGRLSVRNYEDENKQKRTATEIIVESFDFIDKSEKSDKQNNENVENDEFPFN